MNRHVIVSFILFICAAIPAAPYDFSAVDTLLSNNLTTVFRGGVVCLVAKNDSLIYAKELGNLTRTSQRQVASVTKTFSGALILALCDAGIISLDDSVGRYLPVYTANNKNRFTIRQCFAHTAGWGTADDSGYLNSNTMSLQQVADSVGAHYPLAYTPGSAFLYTGMAMQIAGAMAEKAAGKSWNELFTTYIADKCSLTNTEYCTSSPQNPRVAGGICSTPDDILKLASMISNRGMYHGRRVISEAAVSEMWQDQTNRVRQTSSPYPFAPTANNPYNVDTVYYGVGDWLDIRNPATGYVEVISGNGAFGTSLWIDRCTGVTGVIFTVAVGGACWPTEFQVMDIIRAQTGGGCASTSVVPRDARVRLQQPRSAGGRPAAGYDIRGRRLDLTRPGSGLLIRKTAEVRLVVTPARR